MSLAARVRDARPLGGPRFLDRRFDSAGTPLPCAGNTIIRHISIPSDLDRMCDIQDKLKAGPAGKCFGWLPRASLHCTIFNGLLYGERKQEAWPTTLRNDVTRAEADSHIEAAFLKTTKLDDPVEMTFGGLSGIESDALGVSLIPGAADNAALRRYRDDLAEASGLSHRPGHDSYIFHITLGYLISWPNQADAEAFDVASQAISNDFLSNTLNLNVHEPEFCRFQTIAQFDVETVG